MELLIRCSAVLILTALVGLLIRRTSPEITLLLSIASVTTVLLAAFSLVGEFRTFTDTVQNMMKGLEPMTAPILKCVGVAVTTRMASDLCRDASQSAASSALELLGTICALGVAMPLILSVVKTIGGLL